ncbi:MAG: 4-coumarate--CoA ligase, partial [Reyranella sp.]
MSPDQPIVPQPAIADIPDFISIPEYVARHARAHPDKPAVKCDGVTRSWAEFDKRINRIARRLAEMKLGRG